MDDNGGRCCVCVLPGAFLARKNTGERVSVATYLSHLLRRDATNRESVVLQNYGVL